MHKGRRIGFEKWFRFPRWSTRRKIGPLSPCAMMDHCGFIMARGRELRIYRRLLNPEEFRRTERTELSRHQCRLLKKTSSRSDDTAARPAQATVSAASRSAEVRRRFLSGRSE